MSKKFEVDEVMQSLSAELGVVLREAAKRVGASLVLTTPIGRPDLWQRPAPAGYRPGTARGNWRAAIGRLASESELNIQDPAGATTVSLIQSVVNRWNGKEPLFISNAADHIGPLNDGTASRQTNGPNFVDRAIRAGIESLDNVTKELP